MPQISYQEIVTADVSETGTVSHLWSLNSNGTTLYHYIDNMIIESFHGKRQVKSLWKNLCK